MVDCNAILWAKQEGERAIYLKFMETKDQKTKKEVRPSGAEKPISLWGAPFTEVLGALLKTKPMPKEKEKGMAKKSE
jgi:hypothetical protein